MKPINLQPGDKVRLRPLTVHIAYGDGTVTLLTSAGTILLSHSDIERVEPRPLKPGDKVRHTPSGACATIISTHDGEAWVKSVTVTFIAPILQLERTS